MYIRSEKSRRPAGYKLQPQQRNEILDTIYGAIGSGIQGLGLVLDTPGAMLRGLLAKGDPLTGVFSDFNKRVSGTDLLESYGVRTPKKIFGSPFLGNAAKFTTGLATEIALDPMWLLGSGLNAATKAGRVLGKTQYADDVARIWQRKNIDTALDAMRKKGDFSMADTALADPVALELAAADDLIRQTRTGRVVADRLQESNVPFTRGMREVAPPVGPRRAMSDLTLRDVVKYAGETGLTKEAQGAASAKALQELDLAARTGGFLRSPTTFEEIADLPLAGSLRVGAFDASKVFNPAAGKEYLDFIDSLGARVKYSAPVVRAASYLQKDAGEATTLAGQLQSLRRAQVSRPIKEQMNVRIADHTRIAKTANEQFKADEVVRRQVGADDLFSPKATAMLQRIAEDVPNSTDTFALAKIPALRAWADSWGSIRKELLDAKEKLGIEVDDFTTDHFGVAWSPRVAEEADFTDMPSGASVRNRAFGVQEDSDLARTIRSPGGAAEVGELSLDPMVGKFINARKLGHGPSQRDMKDWLVKELSKRHGPMIRQKLKEPAVDGSEYAYKLTRKSKEASRKAGEDVEIWMSDKQVDNIIGLFKRMDPEYHKRGIPLFSTSPVKAQQRGMRKAAEVIGNAEFVYETLADNAVRQFRRTIPGDTNRTMEDALSRVTKQLGLAKKLEEKFAGGVEGIAGVDVEQVVRPADSVVKNLKERMLRLIAPNDPSMTLDAIDLKQFSIPESVVNTLTDRISSYTDPVVKKQTSNFLNSFTALFKNSVLAKPARFVRDFYSNGVSIFFETGSVPETLKGMNAAIKIINGEPEKAFAYLKKIPQFQGSRFRTINDITDQIARDSSEHQLLGGLASSDLFNQNNVLSIAEYYPGAIPKKVFSSYNPLSALGKDSIVGGSIRPDPSRTWRGFGEDLLTTRGVNFFGKKTPTSTRNPFFKASEDVGDTVDSFARLGGYLALLSQGNSPAQAAKRMKRALVDYSTLTNYEREKLVKFWLPWWSYNSRMGAYIAGQLARDPGGNVAQVIRGYSNLGEFNDENYVPTSLRDRVGIKIGNPSSDVERYFTNIDLPFGGLNIYQPSRDNPLIPDVQGTVRNIALQLGPIPRSLMELGSGIDTFTGRPLKEADTTANRVAKSLGLTRGLSPVQKIALSNAPLVSLLEPFVRPFTDDRLTRTEQLKKFLMNYNTGFKFQDVDAKYRLRDQLRQAAPLLEEFTRTFPVEYVPEENKQTLTPAEEMLLNFTNDTRKMLREINR